MKHELTTKNSLKEIKDKLNEFRVLNGKTKLRSLKTSKSAAIQTLELEIEEYQDKLEANLISNIFDESSPEEVEVKSDSDSEKQDTTDSVEIKPEPFVSKLQEEVIQQALIDLNKPKEIKSLETAVQEVNDELLTITEPEVLNLMELDLTGKKSRKDQVLHIIQNYNTTTSVISNTLGISSRNVSSILTYLRQDGWTIDTNKSGKECFITLNKNIPQQETKTTVSKQSSIGRKQQLFKILDTEKQSTMNQLATDLGVTKKNISSLLTYLRSDGHIILTKRVGKETTVTLIEQ